MRTELLNYFSGSTLTNFAVSQELPFTNNNTVMYIKNPKRIYADLEQVSTEPYIQFLNGCEISQEVHSVSVFFTTDAKNLPSNYQTVVDTLKLGKNVSVDASYFKRTVDTTTSFESDLMVTQLDFKFTKLT